jgi:hypothetical protein
MGNSGADDADGADANLQRRDRRSRQSGGCGADILDLNDYAAASLLRGSPSVIVPNGSSGHLRDSWYPALPHFNVSGLSGSPKFKRPASMNMRVKVSNQPGAALNISVNLADSSVPPVIVAASARCRSFQPDR